MTVLTDWRLFPGPDDDPEEKHEKDSEESGEDEQEHRDFWIWENIIRG